MLLDVVGEIKQEFAIVLKVKDNGLQVSPKSCLNRGTGGCGTDKKNVGCGACSTRPGSLKYFYKTDTPKDFKDEQLIEIEYFAMNKVFASLTVFGLPATMILLSFITFSSFMTLNSNSPALILPVLSGAAAGFFGIYLIEKILQLIHPIEVTDPSPIIPQPDA